jgi:hypothetical protein
MTTATTLVSLNAQALTTPPQSPQALQSLQGNAPQETEPLHQQKIQLQYKFGLSSSSFANEKDQSQAAGFNISLLGNAKILPSVEATMKASANLMSSYSQSQFGENTGKTGLSFSEGTVNWHAINDKLIQLDLRGGAIDQSYLNSPLLVSPQPFPGVNESFAFGTDELRFTLSSEQTIPTSSTLTTKSVDSEPTPSFLATTAGLQIKPIESVTGKIYATHFAYNKLPSQIALDSQVFGNTVEELGPNTSQFKYGFNGLLGGGEIQVEVAPRLSWMLSGQVLKNFSAPETDRNAQLVRTGLSIGLPHQIDFKPSAEVFFAESDSSPAYYNSSEFGHNNRQGWATDVELYFNKEKFKVLGRYVDADLINTNLLQSRQKYILIKFETTYELL